MPMTMPTHNFHLRVHARRHGARACLLSGRLMAAVTLPSYLLFLLFDKMPVGFELSFHHGWEGDAPSCVYPPAQCFTRILLGFPRVCADADAWLFFPASNERQWIVLSGQLPCLTSCLYLSLLILVFCTDCPRSECLRFHSSVTWRTWERAPILEV